MLDKETERDLLVRHKSGDRAATDRLVMEFTPLIRSMARKRGNGQSDLSDLIQEGMVGFIDGLNKFDLAQDVRVATYAHYHIMLAMQIYTHKQYNMLHIPFTSTRRAVIGEVTRLKDSGLTFDEMVDQIAAKSTLTRELVYDTCLSATNGIASLDAPTISGDGAMVDTVADDVNTEADVVDALLNDARRVAIEAALRGLPERDLDIVHSRLLCEGPPESRTTIAERHGVTKQRIHQLQVKLEDKLRKRLCKDLI